MRLTLKYYPKLIQQQLNMVEELSFHTTKLYNIANYRCREEGVLSYVDLEKLLRRNWHRTYLHSHNYQQCLKLLDQDWRSYFRSGRITTKTPTSTWVHLILPSTKDRPTKTRSSIPTL